MSHIRSKNTTLDLEMRRLLRNAGIRFRSYPRIFGKPDFLVKGKIALFCDSSFWHGREWPKLRRQLEGGSRATYWVTHIANNRKRDRQVTRFLEKSGYTVARFWDTDIFDHPKECIRKLTELSENGMGDEIQIPMSMSQLARRKRGAEE